MEIQKVERMILHRNDLNLVAIEYASNRRPSLSDSRVLFPRIFDTQSSNTTAGSTIRKYFLYVVRHTARSLWWTRSIYSNIILSHVAHSITWLKIVSDWWFGFAGSLGISKALWAFSSSHNLATAQEGFAIHQRIRATHYPLLQPIPLHHDKPHLQS
jgi:hypothetical protein